jgi:uncharacterized protein (DUF1800 family)
MKLNRQLFGLVFSLLIMSAAHADIHDDIFSYGFDIPSDAPANVSAASRFLTQATFGPAQADISKLMALGYSEWINEQLAVPATLGEPTVESVVNALTADGQKVGQAQRLNRWFWQAAYAPDQLRQRMAFALSQIFVISDQDSMIVLDVVPMMGYQDLLASDAFESYRTLLGDVTYNPMMSKYLTTFHNLKTSATTSPDENYAREVMQLFSVGLIELNLDHSPVLQSGLTIPTYDQDVILQSSKVFTGFTYIDAPIGTGSNFSGANFYGGGLTFAAQSSPMACWGTELFPATGAGSNNMKHDITGYDGTVNTPKQVLGGATIPGNQTCSDDVSDELNVIASHTNSGGHTDVAPFISRQLIERFVTSNPSPQYIKRVATVFETSGGDLGDVVRAILTDTEARNPPTLKAGDSYGKLREPLLRLTAMWRAFNAQAPVADQYGEIVMTGGTNFLASFGQGPLESPTVFNFYSPDYQQPGTFSSEGLYSPELEITNASTTYSAADTFYSFTAGAYVGMTSPPTNRPLIDLSALTVNSGNPTNLVATLNADLFYGCMSSSMQSTLSTMVTGLDSQPAATIAWSAIYVAMLSPEYATQR